MSAASQCFDVQAAFEKVQQLNKLSKGIYRPFIFAALFSQFLPERFLHLPAPYTDKYGRQWELKVNWSRDEVDLALITSSSDECRIMNSVFWMDKTREAAGYEGFQKVFFHGWQSPESLVYVNIAEPDGCRLSNHLKEQGERRHSPAALQAYTLLLASRCTATVLGTLERLHEDYGMTVLNICKEHLRIRPDLQTGYLSQLDIQ